MALECQADPPELEVQEGKAIDPRIKKMQVLDFCCHEKGIQENEVGDQAKMLECFGTSPDELMRKQFKEHQK